jgi:hypothetical protein
MPDYQQPSERSFLGAVADIMAAVGRRVVVHAFSLLMGMMAGFTAPQSGVISGAGIGFSVYIGLICLIPAGAGKRAEWFVPSGAGLLLALLWSLGGTPWQFTVIWGGALTWVIRRCMRGPSVDWEWVVLPWLIICLYGSLNWVMSPVGHKAPMWLFPLLAAAGWGGVTLYGRHRGNAAQRALLGDACARLEKRLSAHNYPPSVDQAVAALVDDTRRFLRLSPRLGTDSATFVKSFEYAAERLAAVPRGAGAETTKLALAEVGKLREYLDPRLEALEEQERADSPQSAAEKAFNAKLTAFKAQAESLEAKTRALPTRLRQIAGGIAVTTGVILDRMREDPQDVAAGERFLTRYLAAAHTLVDDYAKFTARGGNTPTIEAELARSEELLARLQRAFEEEHVRMLKNDTINFTAELNVLDKLLKMDGR